MTQTFDATFDGQVLRPEVPVNLEPNTKVRVTVEILDSPPKKGRSFLEVAASLKLEGPTDMSTNWEKYKGGHDRPPDE